MPPLKFARLLLVAPIMMLPLAAGCTTGQRDSTAVRSAIVFNGLRYKTDCPQTGAVISYDIKQGVVTKRFSNTANRYSDQLTFMIRRTPKAAEWDEFSRRMGPLRLADWKKSYSFDDLIPPTFISDGCFWKLSFRSGARRVESSGYNVGPKFGEPQAAVEFGELRLEAELDRLVDPPLPTKLHR